MLRKSSAVILGGLLITGCSTKPSSDTVLDLASVHDQAIVLDSHIDLELDLIAEDMDPWSSGQGRADLDKLEAGGMDGAFLIVFAPQGEANADGIETAAKIAERRYQAINRLTEKHPNRIELSLTADDARRIHKAGKRIALIGIENAYPLGNDLSQVDKWAERGVRYVGITHVGHNQFADSSNPSQDRNESVSLHGGLSPLGKDLVKRLNEEGIIVDVSHASKSTLLQAAKLSDVPIIASHSGVAAIVDNPRNLDDESLMALKYNGGVIQIVAYGPYLKDKTPEQKAFETRIRKDLGLEDDFAFMAMDSDTEAKFDSLMEPAKKLATPADIGDMVDHIDYVVKKIGIDHVGISSDFDGGGKIDGWMDASETQNVTQELIARGYSQSDIEKIWGGNLLRALEASQAYAAP